MQRNREATGFASHVGREDEKCATCDDYIMLFMVRAGGRASACVRVYITQS